MTVAKEQERKKAQRKFFSNPTPSNVQNFKLLRAKAGHVVKQTNKKRKNKQKGTRGGISVIS